MTERELDRKIIDRWKQEAEDIGIDPNSWVSLNRAAWGDDALANAVATKIRDATMLPEKLSAKDLSKLLVSVVEIASTYRSTLHDFAINQPIPPVMGIKL